MHLDGLQCPSQPQPFQDSLINLPTLDFVLSELPEYKEGDFSLSGAQGKENKGQTLKGPLFPGRGLRLPGAGNEIPFPAQKHLQGQEQSLALLGTAKHSWMCLSCRALHGLSWPLGHKELLGMGVTPNPLGMGVTPQPLGTGVTPQPLGSGVAPQPRMSGQNEP